MTPYHFFMQKSGKGFTLIEVLLYLALFGILMSGAVVAAYGLFESGSRNQTKAMVQEEGNFLLAKVEWAFASGVTGITVSPSGTQLTVHRFSVPNVVVIEIASGTMQINSTTLNNDNVTVTSTGSTPYFVLYPASPAVPQEVRTAFSLTARTPHGLLISQDFGVTGYIH